jgi:hypothetical protein
VLRVCAMGEEPPANLSFEDGYLRVADCGRAEFLKTIAHSHALGKVWMSGLPNGKGERCEFRSLMSTDYRLAFGTCGRGAMAVRKDLAAIWLPADDLNPRRQPRWPLSFRAAARDLDWRFPPLSTPAPQPGRLLLAENDTEIDERAYRAIMRVSAMPKPGDAPAAFADLQLSWKEFVKLFRKRPANGAGRPISEHDMREMLQLAEANKEPGKVFGVRDAQTLLKKSGRPFDRRTMRTIVNELSSGRGPGRPPKVTK